MHRVTQCQSLQVYNSESIDRIALERYFKARQIAAGGPKDSAPELDIDDNRVTVTFKSVGR